MDINNKPIGVSILCLAYNHEQFIADAIDGFLMQKTSFPFEIIIHEDASTDGTANIIRTYEEKYPGIIKPIYQTENQYSKGININTEFMLPLAKGKYVALCDGDDYWTDVNKLQAQYDALECNPECFMCLHRVIDRDTRSTSPKEKYLPGNELKSGRINSSVFVKILGDGDFFNEVCYFFNAEKYRQYQYNYPVFAQLFMKNKSDDAPMLYYFANIGDVYYLEDVMAVYRRFNIGSWSHSMSAKSKNEKTIFFKNAIDALNEYNTYSNRRFDKELDRIMKYNLFNYYYCQNMYKHMLDPKFDIIWKKQSSNFHKRVTLLSQHPHIWGPIFNCIDAARGLNRH